MQTFIITGISEQLPAIISVHGTSQDEIIAGLNEGLTQVFDSPTTIDLNSNRMTGTNYMKFYADSEDGNREKLTFVKSQPIVVGDQEELTEGES